MHGEVSVLLQKEFIIIRGNSTITIGRFLDTERTPIACFCFVFFFALLCLLPLALGAPHRHRRLVHSFCRQVSSSTRYNQPSTMKFTILSIILPTTAAFAPGASNRAAARTSLRAGNDEYVVAIVGDLHIDPRKMEDYGVGRSHFQPIFEQAKSDGKGVSLVSLGDLGESKNCEHNPESDSELFAGTTQCHEMAAEFLSSFDVPYDVVGGNHDLEGLDEFETDKENLDMYLRAHNKDTPQFCREVADKTLLVGMGSTLFREAIYTSHEVTIDQKQIDWFENLVETHPAEDGWKIFVFSHAPPNGSGLRVLQENHVVNGCCWLNHSNEKQCQKFIELVRENRCIKVSYLMRAIL